MARTAILGARGLRRAAQGLACGGSWGFESLPRVETTRAGMPTATAPAGTSSRTTAPAPMTARGPIETPSRILAPAPVQAPAPIVIPDEVRVWVRTACDGSEKS